MGKRSDTFFFFFFCIGTGVILQDSCAFLHTGPTAHKWFGSHNSEDNAVDVDGFKLFPETLAKHDTNRWAKTPYDDNVELWSWGADLDNANEIKLKPNVGHKHKEPEREVEEREVEIVDLGSNEELPLPAVDSQFLLVSSILPAFLRLLTSGADELLPPMDNNEESFQTSSFSIIAFPEIQDEIPIQSLKHLPDYSSKSESRYTTNYPMCPKYSDTLKPELPSESSIAPSTESPVTFSSESSASSSSSSESESESSSSSSSDSSSSSTSSAESSFSGMKLENFPSIRKLIRKLKNTEISVQLDENSFIDKDMSKPSREFTHRINGRKISFSV